MTLKSALQDVRETTLAAVSGLLGKLMYLASLRRSAGRYEHWGMQAIYGQEPAERALRTAHSEVVRGVLRKPLDDLLADLETSSADSGTQAGSYVENMIKRFESLLPTGKQDTASASHLSSVLLALLKLEKYRGQSTPSTS